MIVPSSFPVIKLIRIPFIFRPVLFPCVKIHIKPGPFGFFFKSCSEEAYTTIDITIHIVSYIYSCQVGRLFHCLKTDSFIEISFVIVGHRNKHKISSWVILLPPPVWIPATGKTSGYDKTFLYFFRPLRKHQISVVERSSFKIRMQLDARQFFYY